MLRFITFRSVSSVLRSLLLLCIANNVSRAADWTTWRNDAGRNAATSEELPAKLALQWQRQLPPTSPAWPEDPRLQFDVAYEPIVAGDKLFVGSSSDDSLTAYNLQTGAIVWRAFAGGPVRFAPVVANDRVYFGADDGCVYCVEASSGKQVWKFDAAPNGRKVLGSERVISIWPVRGGLVLDEGMLYFTVGVWPFEGSFLYAVDAATGKAAKGFGTGTQMPLVIKERSPQGYLTLTKDQIFIPCGRAAVACLDRKTGEWVPMTYRPSSGTSYQVVARDRWLFHGSMTIDASEKSTANVTAKQPVVDDEAMYFAERDNVVAHSLKDAKQVTAVDKAGKATKRTEIGKLWSWTWNLGSKDLPKPATKTTATKAAAGAPPEPALQLHCKAGKQLIGSRGNTLFVLQLAEKSSEAPTLSWRQELKAAVNSAIVANGKLVVATADGGLHVFGPESGSAPSPLTEKTIPLADNNAAKQAKEWLQVADSRAGYCVVLGDVSAATLAELVKQSELLVVAVSTNSKQNDETRRQLQAAGIYGRRVAVIDADPLVSGLPPYLANLIIAPDFSAAAANCGELFRMLRPYGGVALIGSNDAQHSELARTVTDHQLPQANVRRAEKFSLLQRVGALPGAANWTHEYGDPANTLMSQDELVKAPLGVLWFGGPAAAGELFYDRHHWGPSLTVIDGRMLIQGPKRLTAVDVYTGRILWKRALESPDKNNVGRRGEDWENNLAGYHFLAVPDGIYVVQGKECLRLNPLDGAEVSRFRLPEDDDWGTIRVQDDTLLAEAFRVRPQLDKAPLPLRLVALDRHTGKVRWQREANLSFPITAVSKDKVYCFDGHVTDFYLDWKRRGLVPKANEIRTLKAFDLKTGEPVWERSTDQVVTWLGYSAEKDVLITSNKEGMAAWQGKNGDELWKKQAVGLGFKGHPESLWDKLILWKDRILDQRGPGLAYDLKTGKAILNKHPVTGEDTDWEFTKTGHHCNYAIANPHMMTFRADSAGFCDVITGNTSRLEGFRSGCRNSLIPANGVLNSPNFAHGCVCGYSLFTSMAFVHVPENEVWSYNALKVGKQPTQRIGFNFGGRGDRVSTEGTLWLEYPVVTNTAVGATAKVEGKELRYFQQHASFVKSDAETLPWVTASGVEGATTISLTVGDKKAKERSFRVRLYFLEPTAAATAGERTFDVSLQGKAVLKNFDVAKEAGGSLRSVVKEFTGVRIGESLELELTAKSGKTILSGVELVAE